MEFFCHFSMVNKPFWCPQIDHLGLSKGFWKLEVSSGLLKMLKFGKWINNFCWWAIIRIIISVGKEKVQFTLSFYLKQNKEVQLDLQRFEIFIFLSLLPSLPSRKMLEKLMYIWIFTIWNMRGVWNAVRDFITFFTKYKTYLFYVIILSFFIIILSYKEIRLSFKENKTFSVIIILSFKEIRLFCLIIILSFKENKTFCLIITLSFR